MNDLVLIKPGCSDKCGERLSFIIERSLMGLKYETISTPHELKGADLRGKRLLFAAASGDSGINSEYYAMLKMIRTEKDCLEGCIGAVISDGESEFYTKGLARELAFSANMAGCAFIGKSLVEGTGTLKNFKTTARNLSADTLEAYAVSAESLVKSLTGFKSPAKRDPQVVMIHAGNSEKSNTIMLWEMVKTNLGDIRISEISLQDGEIKDCIGCPYTTCRHFGEQKSCFYGGVITEKVYPAILSCDAIVIVSPNYNDAVPAYITALINRLTSLFRVNQLSGKQLFAVVVSGYSGGDLVAMQLIGALNMNKPFILPARFCLFETANDAGEIKRAPDAQKLALEFAQNMLKQIKK